MSNMQLTSHQDKNIKIKLLGGNCPTISYGKDKTMGIIFQLAFYVSLCLVFISVMI